MNANILTSTQLWSRASTPSCVFRMRFMLSTCWFGFKGYSHSCHRRSADGWLISVCLVLNSTTRNPHVMIQVRLFLPTPPIALASHPDSQMDASIQQTVKDSNGELLTGRRWRMNHPFFNTLPFYSDIPGMDDIAGPLQKALGERSVVGSFGALLVVRRLIISCSN